MSNPFALFASRRLMAALAALLCLAASRLAAATLEGAGGSDSPASVHGTLRR